MDIDKTWPVAKTTNAAPVIAGDQVNMDQRLLMQTLCS